MGRKRETETIIAKTIDSMKPEMRRMVIGYHYNHLSIPELAASSGMSQREVYGLIKDGEEKIKKSIEAYHGSAEVLNNHRYLNTEVYLSCAEEAVEYAEREHQTREETNHGI